MYGTLNDNDINIAHYLFCDAVKWLIYVICVCLRIVASNTYCVVILLCLSSSCVSYIASFFGLSIIDCPFDVLKTCI